MKKKLQTRFPATRIKKIMQTDEEVGRIAMAVPLLVSKALELFLQDLCNYTYDVTLSRGAKTVTSVHLKQCVDKIDIFDFLRVIVGKRVPDFGGSEGEGSVTKRRKLVNECNCNDEDTKSIQMLEVIKPTGRGRGRPRGRHIQSEKFEDDIEDDSPESSWSQSPVYESLSHDNTSCKKVALHNSNHTNSESKVRDFDLNVGLDENGDSATWLETQLEGSLDWSSLGMNEMKIDHIINKQQASNGNEEDSDEESIDEE